MPIDPPRIPRLKFGSASYKDLFNYANALAEWIEASYPIDGNGITVTDSVIGNGRQINSDNATSSGASVVTLPLQPYNASSGSTPKISVYPGTFGENAEASPGDSVPTIGGTRIDDATPPTLTLSGSDILIYLQVDVDSDGLITSTSIHSTTSADPPAGDETVLYVRLATCIVTTGASASVALGIPNLRGSQSYELCGGTVHLYTLV